MEKRLMRRRVKGKETCRVRSREKRNFPEEWGRPKGENLEKRKMNPMKKGGGDLNRLSQRRVL